MFFSEAVGDILQQGLIITGIASIIKIGKQAWLRQIDNMILTKKEAELTRRLIKSRVMPEFLFNSLGILHKDLVHSQNAAPEMILQLAEIFSYSLYECNGGTVSLEKELNALEHLIDLALLSAVDNRQIELTVKGDTGNKFVQPLSLVSLFQQNIPETLRCKTDMIIIEILIANNEPLIYCRLLSGETSDFPYQELYKENIPTTTSMIEQFENA
jgi:two-component system, LytTR family, sensor kinase